MSRPVERVIVEDDKLIVAQTQDVQAIVDQNHRIATDGAKWTGQARWRHACSIPQVIADMWARECGAGPGTQEFMEYAKKKLTGGEYSKFLSKGF